MGRTCSIPSVRPGAEFADVYIFPPLLEACCRMIGQPLPRMEIDGVIESYWGTTENTRKAKYYRLPRRGIRQLQRETDRWNAISGAVAAILQDA